MQETERYTPRNHVRIVTAASLFDGHDAAINIVRRILQANGAEVIHLGHNRSAREIIRCAVQEDAQAVAVTSYQGGHIEFFKYMVDLLEEAGCSHVKIVGGGGGVILPEEIEELQAYGVARIYSPDDGRRMGLQGMINDVMALADFPAGRSSGIDIKGVKERKDRAVAAAISAAENIPGEAKGALEELRALGRASRAVVVGVTGTGGSGKSSMVDEIVRRYLTDFPEGTAAIISADPSKRKTGGALLGDRIRMNSIDSPRVYMRSLATRQSNIALSPSVMDAVSVVKAAGFDLVILETSGIGQADTEIVDHSDISLYVMTPDYGAASQLEKIDMLDYADLIALNKFDKMGALDALRDVRKQYQRNHTLFDKPLDEMPVYGTIASQFNDPGVTALYRALMVLVGEKNGTAYTQAPPPVDTVPERFHIIPPERVRYLSEIAETVRDYNAWAAGQAETARKLFGIRKALETARERDGGGDGELVRGLEELYASVEEALDPGNRKILEEWPDKVAAYKKEFFRFTVRDREVRVATRTESLSHLAIPKVVLPRYEDWGDILHWSLQENTPGDFPYAAGAFPFKREREDPTRMFAGEGGPERTNKRFHYVSQGMPAKRLSTAFDSVTLYGENPDVRPDIYGKIGNSGVSISCLDDAKKLYSGFDLADPTTSVSMTINGPAPMLVAFFMNAAVDQQCEIYIRQNGLEREVERKIDEFYARKGTMRPRYRGDLPGGNDGLGTLLLGMTGDRVLPREVYEKIKADTISRVRGTVQADILKEDQAQNTCIFSTDFSLRLMGDVQEYFIANHVRNFYSVSISGYHIAEAGANPVTQLAFTLANGFTYVEYYTSRGMEIDSFAPNLSFFFSNGIDPEYAVLGRVARKIWAKAIRLKYGGNGRSQKLKYHIQTSGRSLHAQEIGFNDIRTTLQAVYAVFDNCNSLHTNAYDEAITTPTEESVRKAIAIQMIINHEYGLAKNQNPNQGSFIIELLTDLVEEAVLVEFDRLTQRGGVLGAMETMYQRSRIQDESLYYEQLKHSGKLPIIGVNTFLSPEGSPTIVPGEVIRATEEEKKAQIEVVRELHRTNEDVAGEKLKALKTAALRNENVFEAMMEAAKYCSLGQLTGALFDVGGEYRRNM